MKPSAAVYSSNTGFTERYAKMFGEKTGLPVFSIAEAKNSLAKGTAVVYFGWLMAGTVADYKKALKMFDIKALCGVSLAPTGVFAENIRKKYGLPADFPVFNVQGGMDHSKLKGIYGHMIKVLIKFMSKKKNRTPEDEAMLGLLISGGDFVSEENLSGLLDLYKGI